MSLGAFLPPLDWLYVALFAALAGGLVYERYHLIDEGEARIKAQDAKARQEQAATDAKTSSGIITQLRQDNARLKAMPPPTPVRLCVPTRYVRAGSAPTGTQPSEPHGLGTGDAGVPEGTTVLDIGQPVSDLTWAAGEVSLYRDLTWEWAMRQAK